MCKGCYGQLFALALPLLYKSALDKKRDKGKSWKNVEIVEIFEVNFDNI